MAHPTNAIGNPIHNITADEIRNGRYSSLLVENPDTYNAKRLIALDFSATNLRLKAHDGIENIINDNTYPNNYSLILPINFKELDIKNYPRLTSDGLNEALKSMPSLTKISAQYITNNIKSGPGNFWEIEWKTDGNHGSQTASFAGLKFVRHSFSGTWSQWGFADDECMIGKMALSFWDSNNVPGRNVMGWIAIPSDVALSYTKYPRLYDFVKTHFHPDSWKENTTLKVITLSKPDGFYPRFMGQQSFRGTIPSTGHTGTFTNAKDTYSFKPGYKYPFASYYPQKSYGVDKYHFTNLHLIEDDDERVRISSGAYSTSYLTATDTYRCTLSCGKAEKEYITHIDENISVTVHGSRYESHPYTLLFSLIIYAGYPNT